MKISAGILLMLLMSSILLAQVKRSEVMKTAGGKNYYLHTVEKGTTLYSLSKTYSVSIQEIQSLNEGLGNELKTGMILRIPAMEIKPEAPPKIDSYIFHIAGEGETLTGIAEIYGCTVDELRHLNPETDKPISKGQYIKIPVKKTSPNEDLPHNERFIKHSVIKGETLYGIAKKYQVSQEEVKRYNPGIGEVLGEGQILFIPVERTNDGKPQDTLNYRLHTVKKGETLYRLALIYRVSIDSIRILNPGIVEDIYTGETLKIPVSKEKREFISHTVERRTRLRKVAGLYSIEENELEEANPGVEGKLNRGDIIMIPLGPEAAPLSTKTEEEAGDLHELPEEIVRLADLDSIRCHHDYIYNDRVFNVALMIPLYLDDLDASALNGDPLVQKEHFPKSLEFLPFYEGFMMAVDSLLQDGLRLKLHVYDVSGDAEKTIRLLQKPILREMNLIIGPFFRNDFKLVASFAQMYGINIINPLTQREELISHPNAFKVLPSPREQLNVVEKLIKKDYTGSRIILVRHNRYKDSDFIDSLRTKLEMNLDEKIKIANSYLDRIMRDYSLADTTLPDGEVLESLNIENIRIYKDFVSDNINDSTTFKNQVEEVVYMDKGIDGIKDKASIARHNLILVYSDNQAFVYELLTRLNELKDSLDMTVIGLPEWQEFRDLETEHLMNLKVHLMTWHYTDYEDTVVKSFIRNYRQKYLTEPGDYAFHGFDIGFYFLNALLNYGSHFERCLPYYDPRLILTKYRFLTIPDGGFENRYWNILTFYNYKPLLINDF
ncbi:MAG: LysM peptidoglycan-binding domain-containing protein [Bacteroidetes bacterium]|nr:LysM peptidoglycan-binding domain-containing protein [Bacteroidota bacterium]